MGTFHALVNPAPSSIGLNKIRKSIILAIITHKPRLNQSVRSRRVKAYQDVLLGDVLVSLLIVLLD